MGGREHSVVVDPDSWTVTTERKNKTDSLLRGHMTEDTVKGRQQEGCGVQVWDRVMLSWAHGGGTFSWRHTSFSHLYLIPLMILHCTNKQIQIYIYGFFFWQTLARYLGADSNKSLLFFTPTVCQGSEHSNTFRKKGDGGKQLVTMQTYTTCILVCSMP